MYSSSVPEVFQQCSSSVPAVPEVFQGCSSTTSATVSNNSAPGHLGRLCTVQWRRDQSLTLELCRVETSSVVACVYTARDRCCNKTQLIFAPVSLRHSPALGPTGPNRIISLFGQCKVSGWRHLILTRRDFYWTLIIMMEIFSSNERCGVYLPYGNFFFPLYSIRMQDVDL